MRFELTANLILRRRQRNIVTKFGQLPQFPMRAVHRQFIWLCCSGKRLLPAADSFRQGPVYVSESFFRGRARLRILAVSQFVESAPGFDRLFRFVGQKSKFEGRLFIGRIKAQRCFELVPRFLVLACFQQCIS